MQRRVHSVPPTFCLHLPVLRSTENNTYAHECKMLFFLYRTPRDKFNFFFSKKRKCYSFPFFFGVSFIEFGKRKVKSSYLGFRFETDVTFVPKRKFGFLPILSTKEDEWKKTFGFNLRRFKYVRVAIEKLYL